jgi:hypothetical protein
MKYAVEMGSGNLIYNTKLIMIDLDIRKLIWWIHRHTDSMVIS